VEAERAMLVRPRQDERLRTGRGEELRTEGTLMQRRDIVKGLRDGWLLFEHDGTWQAWDGPYDYPLDLARFQTFVFVKTGAKVRLVDAPGIPVHA
jgi:hypothetical protein